MVAVLIAAAALASIVAHNAATYETFEPTTTNARRGAIEYGWPVTLFAGSIDVERMFYATGPRQHWAATTNGTLLPLGLLVNVGIACLLVFTTYSAIVWTLQSFNAKLSIATLLGLVSYAALVFAFEVVDNAEHYEMFPRLRELFVETCVFDYIEKVVWLTLFIACLWIPNRLAKFCCTRERAGNHAMHRSGR